jgi:hypothetical protein
MMAPDAPDALWAELVGFPVAKGTGGAPAGERREANRIRL